MNKDKSDKMSIAMDIEKSIALLIYDFVLDKVVKNRDNAGPVIDGIAVCAARFVGMILAGNVSKNEEIRDEMINAIGKNFTKNIKYFFDEAKDLAPNHSNKSYN